jgi:lipoprotein-anchoring transpeptidase ErfK/SrfK
MKTNGDRARLRKVSSTVEAAAPVAATDLAGDTPAATARDCSAIRPCLLLLTLFIASCATPDTRHQIVISAREQKLALLDRGNLMAIYPISTSKFGLGDRPGSRCTPLGQLEIAKKIGDHAPPGAVFKDRRRTGEIVAPDSPGRDPIVTRVLWLRGREAQNGNALARNIYIHGTPEERNIGLPASYGCIRMRSSDIISLYEIVGRGAEVTIIDAPLVSAIPTLAPPAQLAATNESTTSTIH